MPSTNRFPVTPWRLARLALLLIAGLMGSAMGGGAFAEPLPPGLRLVMVEDASCIYCRRWLAEVGPYYSTSRQGMRAPLERRNTGDASLSAFGRLTYTPTFLLVEDGREVGRLVGYGGAKQFWSDIDRLLKAHDERPAAPRSAPSPAPEDRPSDPPSEQETRLQPWRSNPGAGGLAALYAVGSAGWGS